VVFAPVVFAPALVLFPACGFVVAPPVLPVPAPPVFAAGFAELLGGAD
jgi:hypothetical protein